MLASTLPSVSRLDEVKAAIEREQCQTKEQREQSEARFDFAESRLSSRNSNCLGYALQGGGRR